MPRRQFGNVRQLPSGRWQARFTGPDGRLHGAPNTFRTKADANRWLAKTETELSSGQWIDPRTSAASLGAYAAAWLDERTVKGRPLAPRTRQTYEHSLTAWILPTLGKERLSAITPARVRAWHSKTLKATGPTATRQAYALLRAIFNTAVADDVIARNPCRITGAGQPNSPERPLLDLEQVNALAAAMPEHLRAFVLVAFWAHLRIGEAVALQYGDVNLDAGLLHVKRQHVEIKGTGPVETPPKAASMRVVNLPTQAIDALRTYIAERPGKPTEYLFKRRGGGQLRQSDVQSSWQIARKKVPGAEWAHVHDLRHAGLTLTAQLGATVAEVQRRAGHASTRAALIYQHAAASRDREIAEMLSKLSNIDD